MDMHVWGKENIPSGAKIYVINHITAHDPFWVLPVVNEPVHIIIGPGYHSAMSARFLNAFEQISAMPNDLRGMVTSAVGYLRKGEAIGIAPEGDLSDVSHLGEFHPGVAAIYRQERVPIVPIALLAPRRRIREYPKQSKTINGRVFRMVKVVRGPYCINIGEPMLPELPEGARKGQNDFLLRVLRERLESLIQDIRTNKFWT